MSQILTCYRCPAAKTGCERRERAKRDAKAGGFRTVAFRCDVKRAMYPIGAVAHLDVWLTDDAEVFGDTIDAVIIGWSGRKLKMQAIEPFDNRMIFKVWPDRVRPRDDQQSRPICACGYATTPLGSCVQPFPDFQCFTLSRRIEVHTYWGDVKWEPLNEYGPEVLP